MWPRFCNRLLKLAITKFSFRGIFMKCKIRVGLLVFIFVWMCTALGSGEIQLYQEGKLEELKLPFYRTWIVGVDAAYQSIYESYGISYSRVDTSELRGGFTEEFFRLYDAGEINVTLSAPNIVVLSGYTKGIKIIDPYLHGNLEKYFKELRDQEEFGKIYKDAVRSAKNSLVKPLTACTRRTNAQWRQELQFELEYDGVKETFRLLNKKVAKGIGLVGKDRSVKVFNMSGCHSTTCFNALIEVLKKRRDIEVLILANNNTARNLLDALKRNTKIQVIDLFGNELADDVIEEFKDTIKRNRNVQNSSPLIRSLSMLPGGVSALVKLPDTDSQTLNDMLQNPAVDTAILTDMLNHPNADAELLQNIAEHPEADAAILLAIMQKNIIDAEVLEAVANNPQADDDMLTKIVLHPHATPDLINTILRQPNISNEVLATIVAHSRVTAEILAKVAADPNVDILTLFAVAQNPITDLVGLNAIVSNSKTEEQLLVIVATHSNADSSLLATILTRYPGLDASVLSTIAQTPLANSVILSKIIGNPNITPAILAAVAANKNADSNNLLEIVRSPVTDMSGLHAVILHPALTSACLAEIAVHPSVEITLLRSIANHPRADANALLAVVQSSLIDQMGLMMVGRNQNADVRVKNAVTAALKNLVFQKTSPAPLTVSVHNVTIDNMLTNTAGFGAMPAPSPGHQAAGLLAMTPQASAPQGGWFTAAAGAFMGLIKKEKPVPTTPEELVIAAVGRMLDSQGLPKVSSGLAYDDLISKMNLQPDLIDATALLTMAQNPQAGIDALMKILYHPQVDAITIANIAAHANADLQVLFAVAMHPVTDLTGLTVVIRNPRANGLILAIAANHLNADHILHAEIEYYGTAGTAEQVPLENIRYYSTKLAARWRNQS